MLLLSHDQPVRGPELRRLLGEWVPGLAVAADGEDSDGSISFRVGEADVVLARMPAPIPWSELEGPCATSILWPNAAADVKAHTVHWIVTVSGEMDLLANARLLTQVSASALGACDAAIGVYWGNATLLVPKALFIDFTREILPQGPPLHIWVDFRVGRTPEGKSSGFTNGLQALGHMEFEAAQSPKPPAKLRDRLCALAGYVLEHGPVIRDGDTVGDDAAERIRIVHGRSEFGLEDEVKRLTYETGVTKKPWWKPW